MEKETAITVTLDDGEIKDAIKRYLEDVKGIEDSFEASAIILSQHYNGGNAGYAFKAKITIKKSY